jgi:hypothetical protein
VAGFLLYWRHATASEMTAMVPFFVQFKCKLGQSYAVANALAEAEIASEIYSTAGDYDLLVKFYVDNDTDIGHFVNEGAGHSRHPGHPYHHHLQGVRHRLEQFPVQWLHPSRRGQAAAPQDEVTLMVRSAPSRVSNHGYGEA